MEEVSLVYSANEMEHWAKQGKFNNPPRSYDFITQTDTVILQPDQKCELLFKFQTFREVSHALDIPSSSEVIRQRNVRIVLT